VIFNATTISCPKVSTSAFRPLTDSTFGIACSCAASNLIAAIAQLASAGGSIAARSNRCSPCGRPAVPLLALAGTTENYLMLAPPVAMMFFVFGQIPINDAMIRALYGGGMACARLCGALCRLVRGERTPPCACRLDLQVERGLKLLYYVREHGVCHLCRGIVVPRRGEKPLQRK